MLDRFAIYGVPVLAGLIVAAVLLGPGREHPVDGARVRGVLVDSARHFSLRVETLRCVEERYGPARRRPLIVELRRARRTVGRWVGTSDEQGLAEAWGPTDTALGEGLTIAVESGDALLAAGVVRPGPPLAPAPQPSAPSDEGPVTVWARLSRGVAVPSFPERLEIGVGSRRPGTAGAPAAEPPPTLSVTALGAEVGPTELELTRAEADGRRLHRFATTVVVQALTAEVVVTARTSNGQSGRWEGRLPVLAAGLWLAPTSYARGRLEVHSATPRARAYLSLIGVEGRLWGTSLSLDSSPNGFGEATTAVPETAGAPRLAMLASDPAEPEGATIAWPLVPAGRRLAPASLQLLLDGMPAALAAERARVSAVRRPAYGLILAAALFELIFLIHRHRSSGQEARQRLRAAVNGGGSADRAQDLVARTGLLWLTVLTAGVVLAFAVLAALAAWG